MYRYQHFIWSHLIILFVGNRLLANEKITLQGVNIIWSYTPEWLMPIFTLHRYFLDFSNSKKRQEFQFCGIY